MSFNWSSDFDSQTFRQLTGLIKTNRGFFKSAKQAAFLSGDRSPLGEGRNDYDSLKTLFNVDAEDGQKVVSTDGYAVWSAYGGRGLRPVTWMFVLDQFGVVRQYKLRYSGCIKPGTRPDASKTELLFDRTQMVGLDLEAEKKKLTPEPEKEDQIQRVSGNFVGRLGERIVLDLICVRVYPNAWGGESTIFETLEGDLIFYSNTIAGIQTGQELTIKATVKKHLITRDGKNATVISRAHRDKDDSLRRQNPTLMAAWKKGDKKAYRVIRDLVV